MKRPINRVFFIPKPSSGFFALALLLTLVCSFFSNSFAQTITTKYSTPAEAIDTEKQDNAPLPPTETIASPTEDAKKPITRAINAKATLRKKYARIILPLNKDNSAIITAGDQKITYKFASPITVFNATDIVKKLGGIVRSITSSSDNLQLTISLSVSDYRTREFIGGSMVGVDIIPLDLEKPFISDDNDASQSTTETQEDEKPKNLLEISRFSIMGGTGLSFPFNSPVSAAAYGRYDKIWLFFDKPFTFTHSTIQGIKYIKKVTQKQYDGYTTLIIHLNSGYTATQLPSLTADMSRNYNFIDLQMRRDENTWKLHIINTQKSNAELGAVKSAVEIFTGEIHDKMKKEGEPLKRKITLNVQSTEQMISFIDPNIGDEIFILPLYTEYGVKTQRSFIDLNIYKSPQGIIIKKLSDHVQISHSNQKIDILSSEKLNISPELFSEEDDENYIRKNIKRAKISSLSNSSILPFKLALEEKAKLKEDSIDEPINPEEDTPFSFDEKKRFYMDEIAKIDEEGSVAELQTTTEDERKYIIQSYKNKKSIIRLELAKLYFSEKLYAEALGMINDNRTQNKSFAHASQESDAIGAASNYLLERYTDAYVDFKKLADESTEDDENLSEFLFWQWASLYQRSLIYIDTEKHEIPTSYVDIFSRFMRHYPTELKYHFGMIALEDRFSFKDTTTIDGIFTILGVDGQEDNIPKAYRNDLLYYKGLLAETEEKTAEAESIWTELSKDIDDRRNRARAQFSLTRLQLLNGKISVDEAVHQFNKTSVVWRGDMFEFTLLKLIGQLYIKNGDYLKGLRAWHLLVKVFPQSKESIYIAGMMKKYFVKLFDKGLAYELEPFDALALFFEFRELTPIGDKGDSIIQQLVEHFINTDLLDNATAILYHQVKFRITGKARDKLALKLARLQLKNKKSRAALEALDFIDLTDAPTSLKDTVLYIKARAFLDQKKEQKVYDLLQSDFTSKAQDLRLDIFWKHQNWFGIIDIVEPRLSSYQESAPGNLKTQELQDIIRLSVAYAAQDRTDALQNLEETFGQRIGRKTMENVFGFVTSDTKEIDHTDYDNTVQLNQIESFVNDYVYWPKKDWKNVIAVLSPKVATYSSPYSREQSQTIVKLGIAYSQLLGTDKTLERDFNNFLRVYSKEVTVNRDTIHTLSVFDDVYLPMEHDAIFDQKISMKDLTTLVQNYQSVKKISDLNAFYR